MKRFFSLLWAGWKKFAHILGLINTKILLTITYFIVMAVVAIVIKVLGKDLLERKIKRGESQWVARESKPVTLEMCKRQF